MKKGNRGTKTLRSRILFSILSIVLLQITIFTLIIGFSGTRKHLNMGTEQVLKNTVDYKSEALEEQMLKWSDFSMYMQKIEQYVATLEEEKGIAAAELMKNQDIRDRVLEDTSMYLLNNLRDTKTTGSFLILEDASQNQKKSALYLRDLNPASTPVNNFDILVEAGGGKDILNKGFTMDSQWSMELLLSSASEFYDKPMEAAIQYPDLQSRDLGYFSEAFRLRENDIQVITYTVPLLDKDKQPYGVLGVELSLDYLRSFLPAKEIGVDENGAYLLGIRQKNGEVRQILVEGSFYRARIGDKDITLKQREKTAFYQVDLDIKEAETLACVKPMQLYNSNTPFEQEEWILAGLVHEDVLYQSSQRLILAFIVSIIMAFLISILGAVGITAQLVKPIRTLMDNLGGNGGRQLRLSKTNIIEIDELATEIERLNEKTFKLGSKVADILEISNLPLGVFEVEDNHTEVFCTKQVLQMWNISLDIWKDNYVKKEDFRKAVTVVRTKFERKEVEEGVYHFIADGEDKYIRFRFAGGEKRILYIIMDVTGEIIEKQKIKRDRDFDMLTNLYNRRAFNREVNAILGRKNCRGAILSVWDLDNLKYVNDTYGHDVGDKYICLLGEVFKEKEQRGIISARISGDEFMVFLYLNNKAENYRRVKDMHRTFIDRKLKLPDGSNIPVSASAGTVEFGIDGITYEEMVRYADFAMYEAKKKDKGSLKAFSKNTYIKNYILVEGVGELNRILKEEDVNYAFQPIVDVRNKKIFAYEALMRPQSGILMGPDELLRIAASQSKLKQIEVITWHHAMKRFFELCKDGDTRLFLNSIPDQCLSEEEFTELEKLYGSRLNALVMEVTELSQTDTIYEKTKQTWCKRWNAKTALDDFGSGYSNTDFLVSREFDFIKLDRGMIQDIQLNASRQRLVQGIIEYCHDNQIQVISEGVESIEEYQEVLRLGTDYVQGYYLGMPSFEIKGMTEQMQERIG